MKLTSIWKVSTPKKRFCHTIWLVFGCGHTSSYFCMWNTESQTNFAMWEWSHSFLESGKCSSDAQPGQSQGVRCCKVQELPCLHHCQYEESTEVGPGDHHWCPSSGPGTCQLERLCQVLCLRYRHHCQVRFQDRGKGGTLSGDPLNSPMTCQWRSWSLRPWFQRTESR